MSKATSQALTITSDTTEKWICHCCTAKNVKTVTSCRVCGRPDSYALSGFPLPFHGKYSTLFRPNQLINVLDDIHATDSENWTALHTSCANGNIAIVRQLLSYKSQIEALTNKGHTPLHLAVHSGSPEIVLELIKHGANVNAATQFEKSTPLHMAAEKGFARITQYLLHAGAKANALDILERTPLHAAAMSGRTDVGLLLLNAGAKIKLLDVHAWEPSQIAELHGHRDFQELLIRESMTEKQAVLKDLPPATWHNDVWFQVVNMHAKRKVEHRRLADQTASEEQHFKMLREQAKQDAVLSRREDRRLERQQQQEQAERWNSHGEGSHHSRITDGTT